MNHPIKTIISIIFILSAISFGGTYSGGTGQNTNPYKISNASDWLELTSNFDDWASSFVLTSDVNLAGITVSPVGTDEATFSGIFDGNDHVICNATINSSNDSVGLFGHNSPDAQIKNLGLKNVVVNVFNHVAIGGLCGINDGIINRCFATGTVNGSFLVGGLCGVNYGNISQCFTTCDIYGQQRLGGLCGANCSTINNCYSTGMVLGDAIEDPFGHGNGVGGLCGWNSDFGMIGNSFWNTETSGCTTSSGGTGKTTMQMQNPATYLDAGWDFVNETQNGLHDIWQIQANNYPQFAPRTWTLCGNGTANDPYLIKTPVDLAKICLRPYSYYRLDSDLDLSAINWSVPVVPVFNGSFDGQGHKISNTAINLPYNDQVGIFGKITQGGDIKNLSLDSVDITAHDVVGSLCGLNDGSIENCSITGQVTAVYEAGGLCGNNVGTISKSCSTVQVNAEQAGGLVADNSGKLISCSASGSVNGSGDVGGLAGNNNIGGVLSSCSSTCSVSGENTVGGLVGLNQYSITGCYASGSVNGTEYAGGLCGYNADNISQCYTTATVNGINFIGGLCGVNGCSITQCYAAGSVVGEQYVGGFSGINTSTINNCYSTGSVTGSGDCVGGLCGLNYYPDDPHNIVYGTVINSFWDMETSGCIASCGGTGKTTIQMQTPATYLDAGWDFANESQNGLQDFWQIQANNYPRFAVQDWTLCGNGTQDDPYSIKTPAELAKIHLRPYAYYRLDSDLDLTDISWTVPVVPVLSGSFDGQGHVIRNVMINLPENSNVGFIGKIALGGQIKNLSLDSVNIIGYSDIGGLVGTNEGNILSCSVSGSATGSSCVIGGLAGFNSGSIISCHAASSVIGAEWGTGGLIGWNYGGGIVTYCFAAGSVDGIEYVGGLVGEDYGKISCCFATGHVNGSCWVGGLVGLNHTSMEEQTTGIMTSCYSTGSVKGTDYSIGGLVGENQIKLINCYSTGSVSGRDFTGGLVGSNYCIITGCFWDKQTSGKTTSSGGTGLTSSQMKTMNTFISAGWDFTSPVWRICDGTNYPKLAWQKLPSGNFACRDGVDLRDFAALTSYWHRQNGDINWDPKYDISQPADGIINELDLAQFAENWLQGF